DVTSLHPSRRPVTMLFQEHNLFAHLSAADNVGLGINAGLRLAPQDRERIGAALAQVGLDGFEKRVPAELSGGERQRVALARSLVRNRPVLLLDEPFAALGPALRREMLDPVNELRRSRRLTVLFVSHQPEDALYAAERTAFVHGGHVLQVALTREIFDGSSCAELKAYLGEHWMGYPPRLDSGRA
ncbi:MAG: ATP-binding cassette domain-containing protein, partial [Dongiaceae bacterium]